MRILNVTESYAPFDEFGGPPVKVRALSEGLAARGHEVTVLTADWGLEKRLRELRGAEPAERSPFGWRRNTTGVTAIYLPTWLHYRAVSWNPAVKRFCRARLLNFDVAHIFGLYDLLGPAVARLCSERSVPYVVEPIGMFTPIVRNLRLKRIYHALCGKRLFREAAAVIATSEQEKEALLAGKIAGDKIVLRRNGVTFPKEFPERGAFRATNAIPSAALVVLFLGRLSAKKSPDLLLESFAALPGKIDSAEVWLVFAGPDEGGMKSRLEQAADRLGVASRVRFTGPVLAEEKWRAYRDADVFVLPSQNENFGNTAAEAAAAGTPVIVTEQCGIAPHLAGGAALVIPHNAGALRNAMETVLGNMQLRESLAGAGARAAARLDWQEPVNQMESVYARLAGSVPRGRQSERQE
jgi:glycosyltransferase involved in cell wall biosynthesis